MAEYGFDEIKDSTGVQNIAFSPTGPVFPFPLPTAVANVRASESGTVNLAAADKNRPQIFSASAALTVLLPSTNVVAGDTFWLYNQSATNLMTVQSSGANHITAAFTGWIQVVALVNAPTSAANWLLITSPSQRGEITYQHGTTYFGGNAPTITLTGGGGTLSAVNYSQFIPYFVNNVWRLRANAQMSVSSATRTGATFGVNGITHLAQSLAISLYELTSTTAAFTSSNSSGGSSNFTCIHASTSTNLYILSCDVQIASKPTWAY